MKRKLLDYHLKKLLEYKNQIDVLYIENKYQEAERCLRQYKYHLNQYLEFQNSNKDVIVQVENEIEEKPYEIPISIRKLIEVGDLNTNWAIHSVPYEQLFLLKQKEEIPAIDKPIFVEVTTAKKWLQPTDPIIVVEIEGEAKGYPIGVMLWHEVVNDELANQPIVVVYCPLCNNAFVFSRKLEEEVYTFGTSGVIRNSCTLMYDRKTESLWESFTGNAIVGDLTGQSLSFFKSNTVPFETFRTTYPSGKIVLSNVTGFIRQYGTNPYIGYDAMVSEPFFYLGKIDPRLPAMERVAGVWHNNRYKAYPYSVLRDKRVIEDTIDDMDVVIFYKFGMTSALDKQRVSVGRDVGASGAFLPYIEGERLNFFGENNKIFDQQTKSEWNLLGKCIEGELKGEELVWVFKGNPFWFAWSAYYPKTTVYKV